MSGVGWVMTTIGNQQRAAKGNSRCIRLIEVNTDQILHHEWNSSGNFKYLISKGAVSEWLKSVWETGTCLIRWRVKRPSRYKFMNTANIDNRLSSFIGHDSNFFADELASFIPNQQIHKMRDKMKGMSLPSSQTRLFFVEM